VQPAEVLQRTGGICDAGRLLAFTSRRKVAQALRRGEIVRLTRGRYALPMVDEGRRAAAALRGIVAGTSAAAALGWEVKQPPAVPCVIVPAKRKVAPHRRAGVWLRWRDVPSSDVWPVHGVDTLLPGPTVIDCAKTLPFDEALAIADSALRHRSVTKAELVALAEAVPSSGRAQSLRVAREASGLAANPFESVLRAVALDVPALDLRPQVVIDEDGWRGRPDLVDVRRRLVVEAESFEFHGKRRMLTRDCERYNALVLRGWTVVRFSWEHVMLQPDYVDACLRRLAGQRAVRQETLPDVSRRTA
jgi:very-short-patch-repair endonuclease